MKNLESAKHLEEMQKSTEKDIRAELKNLTERKSILLNAINK